MLLCGDSAKLSFNDQVRMVSARVAYKRVPSPPKLIHTCKLTKHWALSIGLAQERSCSENYSNSFKK